MTTAGEEGEEGGKQGEEKEEEGEEEEEEEDGEEAEREMEEEFNREREARELKRGMEWGGAAETLASITSKGGAAAPAAQMPPITTSPTPSSPHDPWYPALDSALLKLTQQAEFDFSKVAKGLRNAGELCGGFCFSLFFHFPSPVPLT